MKRLVTTHLRKIRGRIFSPAEIAEGPHGVPGHGEPGGLGEKGEERGENALVQDVVPTLRTVPGDVAEGPDCLLLHVLLLAEEERDKDRNCSGVNNLPRLLTGATGDVGQRPGGLELEDRVLGGAEELNKPRYYSSLDNLREYITGNMVSLSISSNLPHLWEGLAPGTAAS